MGCGDDVDRFLSWQAAGWQSGRRRRSSPFLADKFQDLAAKNYCEAFALFPQITELPPITELPQITLLPATLLLPQMTELPQITEFPDNTVLPQTARSAHATELLQTT